MRRLCRLQVMTLRRVLFGAPIGKTPPSCLASSYRGNPSRARDPMRGFRVAAPEPGTIALLLTGAIGLLAYAWRRQRRAVRIVACLAVTLLTLSAGVVQADVFHMPGGQTSLEFVRVGDLGNASD